MKLLVLAIALLLSQALFASDPPYDMCQHVGQCSEDQYKIYEQFQSCNGFDPSLTTGRVYSGVCYHNSRIYSNEDAHYVATYFETRNSEAKFGGSFAFYFPTNPFSELTHEQAANKYASSLSKKKNLLDISTGNYGHVFWDGTEPENTIEYWYKTCNSNVYLRGAWGPHNQFVCKLKPNQSHSLSSE